MWGYPELLKLTKEKIHFHAGYKLSIAKKLKTNYFNLFKFIAYNHL